MVSAGCCEPPRAMWAAGGLRRQIPADAAASQLCKTGSPALPLLQRDGTQPPPEPTVNFTEYRRDLAEAKVAAPSNQIDGQLPDNLREAFTARADPYVQCCGRGGVVRCPLSRSSTRGGILLRARTI